MQTCRVTFLFPIRALHFILKNFIHFFFIFMYADRINDLCGMFLKGAPYSCIMAMYVLSSGSLNTPLQKMTFVKEGGKIPS
jgi:hypothetical protein